MNLEPRFDGIGVRFQALRGGQSGDGFPNAPEALRSEFLHGNGLDEIGRAKPAAQVRRAGGGQDVISAGSVIAGRNGSGPAAEGGTRRAYTEDHPAWSLQ